MQQNPSAVLESRERVWIASIWLGIAFFRATQTVLLMRSEGMHHAWVALYLTEFLYWVPWYLATPLVRYLGYRHPIERQNQHALLVHVSASMGINLASAAWSSALDKWFNPMSRTQPLPFLSLWLDQTYSGLLLSLFLYAAILSFSYLAESKARLADQRVQTAQLSEQLAKSQLENLRRQIEPHFLFNSLNAVSGLVRERRNNEAVTTIAALSEFLRKTIEYPNRQEVRLGEEVEFARQYLDIQKLRFADHLHIKVEVPEELLSHPVPSLVLQPLVENAVKHGVGMRAQGGSIQVAASRANDGLAIRVYNDGPSLPPDWDVRATGIGIRNVRARLHTLYGDRFRFTLQNEDGGVEALLWVPTRQT